MNQMMRNLFELQTLEFEPTPKPETQGLISEVRAKIPVPVLSHYDRLRKSGKKGVALLRNQTCAACHVQVPLGNVLSLKRGTDVCLCGNCGRYLYLPKEEAVETPAVSLPLTKMKVVRKKSARLVATATT